MYFPQESLCDWVPDRSTKHGNRIKNFKKCLWHVWISAEQDSWDKFKQVNAQFYGWGAWSNLGGLGQEWNMENDRKAEINILHSQIIILFLCSHLFESDSERKRTIFCHSDFQEKLIRLSDSEPEAVNRGNRKKVSAHFRSKLP